MPHRPPSSTIARASELESVTVSLRSAFNATALANHLPYELVVKILSSGAYTRWQELVALTHICQYWRDVALGTPQLWADAVRYVFAGPCRWFGPEICWPKGLPIFLARSEPLPLTIDLPDHTRLTTELEPGAVLQPHVSRLAHLCVFVHTSDALKTVLLQVHEHLRSLESLRVLQARQLSGIPFSITKLPAWDDADLPRLHTLAMTGQYFGKSIAVASLKTLMLSGGPRNYGVFLDALKRCGPALESLTLRDWVHPAPPSDAAGATTRPVQLPRLRRLEVALPRQASTTASLASLFTALSLPSHVAVDLDWRSTPGRTLELLPKHLVGLHTPPFFDSMCLHLSWPSPQPLIAALHGYDVSGTEKLCVREEPILDLQLASTHYNAHHPSSRSSLGILGRFPNGHQWPSVTRLAVDLDIDSPAYDWDVRRRALEHRLHTFVSAFPNLRRLDLLGRTIGSAKLMMVDAFLALPRLPSDSADGGRTLGYVCEVAEDAKTMRAAGYIDALRAQLDGLEARLTRRLSQGGARLRRLELCIAYSSAGPHPPRRAYPDISDVEPSTTLTAYLSGIYMPRFKLLVDEVVFMRGAAQTRAPGYRVVVRRVPWARRHLASPRAGGKGTASSPGPSRKGR